MRTDDMVPTEPASRNQCQPARKKNLIKGLLVATLGAILIATIAPSAAQAATPTVWIDRIDGNYVVQGRNFPADTKGTVWAQLGSITGQKDVWTRDNGYFWVTFYRFTPQYNGPSETKAWIGGQEATATRDMTNYAGHAWEPSEGTSEAFVAGAESTTTSTTAGDAGERAAAVTTTTAKATTTTAKPTTTTAKPAASGTNYSSSPSGWTQTFADNFDGSSLNTSKWGVYEGTGNQGIGRRVRSAVSVGGGELRIAGNGWDGGGVAANLDQTYGRYEIRFRVDHGKGYNTAALLWPSSERWPVDGEIDISETFNGDLSKSGSFIHYGSNNSQLHHIQNGDFSQWHTYVVEWNSGNIKYTLDGRDIWNVTQGSAIPHSNHFLALQLDVARDGTKDPMTLHVDYVKVYKRS